MKWQEIFPVVVSILVIVSVAILERHSKFVAAITATMPIGAPLALWIVFTANRGRQDTMVNFSQGLLLGVLPTLGFLVAVWAAARAELKLGPMLLTGYLVWGGGVGLIFLVKKALGI
ncbi:MAG: hypothetical protein JXA13_10170 [Anaerolineales bacterium]|nr:hypothetical protein [Anaerolineales bacterium]